VQAGIEFRYGCRRVVQTQPALGRRRAVATKTPSCQQWLYIMEKAHLTIRERPLATGDPEDRRANHA
jgi:hypothetical protein